MYNKYFLLFCNIKFEIDIVKCDLLGSGILLKYIFFCYQLPCNRYIVYIYYLKYARVIKLTYVNFRMKTSPVINYILPVNGNKQFRSINSK